MSGRAKKVKRVIPKLKTEDEERKFWATNAAADYFAWDRAVRPGFPVLKPSTP
jgi:hypothetical protein